MSQTLAANANKALPDPRRWKALVFISIAQLMVVLDATIVNIALPSAQRDLHISDPDKQWVITAYALAFGGLLLFGGRIADLWGRKRTFVTGLIGFALASAIGGFAGNEAILLTARAAQGAFGALLAPAALSLLATTFTDAKERIKAFGVFGAIAGGGGAVGLLLGGVLTEYLNWRWTFFANIPFAIIAVLGAYVVIREPKGSRNRSPLDVPGAVLSTLGLISLVYGFTRAESAGWSSVSTIGLFVAAAVLLATFVAVESKVRHPLLPIRVVADRNRGGSYLSLGLAIIGIFGVFLFLTYYLQVIQGYSAIRTGLAFLPLVGALILASTQIGARLVNRLPARALMAPGYAVAAVGMLLFTQLDVDSSYAGGILPGLVLLGLGLGTAFTPAIALSTNGIEPRDAGVASAMVNTSQQVGGAIGTALLNTIAATATAGYLASHAAGAGDTKLLQAQGLVHGYTHAIWWAVGIEAVAALIALILVTAGRPGTTKVDSGADGNGTSDANSAQDSAPVILH
ncbi:drug resistance transporter, EmrB/QacA subfamily [Streptomyces sp. DvalAA-14]|uniref:MFS transporter n=1 Tax=unclassified Streptomyces TaxID=2593676 RepID=UPI00081B9821|nr:MULTISPECIES: MFS transporter [unclassified Streptomyces]MYS21727.1 DHA2 family efflux MFS transporter permease subunit [Streptomyces sp. SID4948]SCD99748.1 drug resistance transporter, EmrB/QacA subfamily [Streptomyces sp. DvalAA-14]